MKKVAETDTGEAHHEPAENEPNLEQLRAEVQALTLAAYDKAKGDRHQAKRELMDLIDSDAALAQRLLPAAYERLFEDCLFHCSRHQRRRIDRRLRNGELRENWAVPENLGAGLAAKRRNMESIYSYQYPFLGKAIGLATVAEFATALQSLKSRHDIDERKIALGDDIWKNIAKADRKAVIKTVITAEALARLFRQHGALS